MAEPGKQNVDVEVRTVVWVPDEVAADRVRVESVAVAGWGAVRPYPGGLIPRDSVYDNSTTKTHCHVKASSLQQGVGADKTERCTGLMVKWEAGGVQQSATFPVVLPPREKVGNSVAGALDVEFVLPGATMPPKAGDPHPAPHGPNSQPGPCPTYRGRGTAKGMVTGCVDCLYCQMKFTKTGSTVYLNLVKNQGESGWEYAKTLAAGLWSVTVTCGGKVVCAADCADPEPVGTINVGVAGTLVTTDFWMQCV